MAIIDFDYPLVCCEILATSMNGGSRKLYTRADEIKECLEMPDGTWRLLTPQGSYTLACDPFNLRRLGEDKKLCERKLDE